MTTVQPEHLPKGMVDELFVTAATTTPTRIFMKIECGDREELVDNGALAADLYDSAPARIGTFHQLYDRLMRDEVWPA